jgi:hypothetical protein
MLVLENIKDIALQWWLANCFKNWKSTEAIN